LRTIGTGLLLAGIALLGRAEPKADEGTQPKESVKTSAPLKGSSDAHQNLFSSNVQVSFTDKYLIIKSDGIPNHPHGNFPNKDNPNTIRKQDYTFYIPLNPKPAAKPTKTPFGPIGVAINGIPFYNQYNAEGGDAVKLEVFDSCCGHPDPQGRYHYHKYPVCVKSPFKDPEGEHSPLIGYAFDGYAIYGPNGEDGKPPTDLDECNGHTDSVRGYHYHVTANYPYILGAYHGIVEPKNFDHGPPGGKGPPEGKSPINGPPFGNGPPPYGHPPFWIPPPTGLPPR
ncbi:MAG TPA: YHYH protein, partial [Pirellulales bacterium]|nr:YHYH protein [Pirellulales bacterium]